MGSALLNTPSTEPHRPPELRASAFAPSQAEPATAAALRRQLAQRLAAHRTRRDRLRPTNAKPEFQPHLTDPRAARIAAVVAERYANSPSYRAVLAAEAERTLQQARAAAEIATRNAQAIQQAHQELLETLNEPVSESPANLLEPPQDQQTSVSQDVELPGTVQTSEVGSSAPAGLTLWPEEDAPTDASPALDAARPRPLQDNVRNKSAAQARAAKPLSPEPAPMKTPTRVGLTVHLYETSIEASRPAAGPIATNRPAPGAIESSHEALALETLDDEIAFRQSPVFEEPAGPPTPIPANLIEFPRQLVAPRRARPRYAEGPLREEDVPAPGDAQLRIFEVETAQISTVPEPVETPTPQWTSIWLDAPNPPAPASDSGAATLSSHEEVAAPYDRRLHNRPRSAPISRRIRAAAIDGALVLTGFVAFTATSLIASGSTAHTSLAHLLLSVVSGSAAFEPRLTLAAAAGTLAIFYLLYQALFFSLSEATPGMRSARIALCTFSDENPTRHAIRRRALAVLISALPFGLGLLWAAFDEDRLAWHDRLTRIYQRSY